MKSEKTLEGMGEKKLGKNKVETDMKGGVGKGCSESGKC